MKAKRFISWLLLVAMMITTVPSYSISIADDGSGLSAAAEPTVIESDTKENTNQAGGIIYTKTSTAKSDGTIDITLTAHTTGVVRQTSSVSPTDIVLVLDVSGSMRDSYTTTQVNGYSAVTGDEYTYYEYLLFFPIGRTGYGLDDTDETYYINTGTEEEPVYTQVTYTGRDSNGFEMYEYSLGNTEVTVYPKLDSEPSASRSNGYDVVQFYKADTVSKTVNKMQSLKDAVNAFITTTEQMNTGLQADEMHRISIVKFAGPHFSNGSTSQVTIAEGNGTYDYDGDTSNYSQVVKGLTAVDADGADALTAAVNSLSPAGSTAVDKGLALAEAVLKNSSAVVAEGAVDRKEVVIVFTDGEPNHWNGFDSDVANDAIALATRMESEADVTVYGVSVAEGADASNLSANINKFMHYMSSNFPNATDMNTPGTDGSINGGYYKTPDNSHSLSMLFESIIQEIDHPTIELGEEATLIDTLSPYFDFANGSATNVSLQTSARNADGTWADPVDDNTLRAVIVEDRLTVDGFDFDANYVSEKGRGDSGDFYGKRLVVSFTVVPDYDTIDAASVTLMDGILPTNSGFASIFDSADTSAADVVTPELSTHQVTYKVDGTEYASYNRFTGSDVTVDAAPVKEGYTFSGWKYPDGLDVVSGEFTMPTNDVTITGEFTVNSHNVSYQYSTTPPAGAPQLPTSHKASYNETVTVAAAPVLDGYVFSGWKPLQTDVEVNAGQFTMPDKDVTLVGYFEASDSTPYKVEHYLETLTDGVYETESEVEEEFTGTTGHTVSATPLNRFTGFTYNAGVSTAEGTITADGLLVLKLYYDRNEYTVTYGYDGDTNIADLPSLPAGGTYRYGETVTVADKAIAPDGYGFTGWYRGTPNNLVSGSFEMPAYDVNLRGFFTANAGTPYKVEHYLMNTEGAYETDPYTTEDFTGTTGETAIAKALIIEGFTYNAGISTAEGTIAGDGSLTLKLYYDRLKYKVVYQYERDIPADATALPATLEYYHGVMVEFADEASASGYNFGGWHLHGSDVLLVSDGFEMPARDVTVYGYFTAAPNTPYRVEHYLEKVDGSGYEPAPYREQSLTATTGAAVTAAPISITGFTYNAGESTASGVVAANGSLVLSLYYDRREYRVTYGYDGDTYIAGIPALPAGGTYRYGETVTVADKATAPTNYEFTGWYRGTPDNLVSGSFEMPAYDVNLRGYFTSLSGIPYKVEHYLETLEDGVFETEPEVTEDFDGIAGNTVSATPLNRFTGFTYNAGISTAEGTIAADGSLTLKLYYERNKYSVVYEYERFVPTDASDLPDTEAYFHGETVDVADDATAKGYTFSGWHIHTDDVDATSGSFEMPQREVRIYGYFTANTNTNYAVKHYIEKVDGSGYETEAYLTNNYNGITGETASASPIAISGFTYNAGISTVSGTIAGDGSLVLELYYDRNEYTVTYVYEGNIPATAPTPPAGANYVFGERVTVADAVKAPAGYTFHGWHIGTVNNVVTEFDMPSRDVELKGYFHPGENTPYRVEHYLETLTDGVYETDPEVEDGFTGKTGNTVSATPLNRFTGFTYNAGISTATGTIAGDGSLVLKLYYDRNEYKVTYGYEGDTNIAGLPALPATETYLYGEEVTVADKAAAPHGYSFVGWYRGVSTNAISGKFAMPAYDVHVLGKFERNTNTPYRVEHYLQNTDGNGYTLDGAGETRRGTTGDTVSALAREYPGFTYNAGISTTSGAIAGDGSLTLKFYYDRNTHSVIYKYEGIVPDTAPKAPAAEEFYYGAEVTVADAPAVPGYTFNGWDTADADVNGGKFDMPDKDVVLVGSFLSREVEYQVNYWFQRLDAADTFDKADYDLSTESYSRIAFVGQHVEADGISHNGFALNSAESKAYGHVSVDAHGNGNLVLDLYFDRLTFDVSYVYYGEQPAGVPDVSDRDLTDVRYGTKVDIADKPTFDGHVFEGWYTHTATVENGSFTMPAHDVTILGIFHKEYTVSYDFNGGKGADGVDYSTKTVKSGTVITVEDAARRAGYVFRGWKLDSKTYDPEDKVEVLKNITFVAQWSKNGGGPVTPPVTPVVTKYTLTYVTNGGNAIPKESYPSDKVVTLVKVPVRDGYAFEGWYLDEELETSVAEVKMTKDITVYAAWVKDNGDAGHGHETPEDLNGHDHFAYIVGYPDGTVKPNNKITRAEVTTIFFRLLEDEIRENNLTRTSSFVDVNSTSWFNTSVSTMKKLGIVNGRTANGFQPNEYITRAEFAAICARFDNSPFEVADNFTDVKGHWAEDEIHEAAAHGWIRGYEDGTFRPNQYITRAEAMTMINRVLNRTPETADDLLDGMITWPDNADKNAWYYLTVQEATNSHDYLMKNNVYEKWSALREVEDWTKYEP